MGHGTFRVERLDFRDSARCEAYFRFRSEYFGHYLGWKVLNANGVDCDDIDSESTHFCLIEGDDTVVGSIRLTPPVARHWMLDMPPFSDLIDHGLDPDYPRTQSAEVSRLGALPAIAGRMDDKGFSAAQALRRSGSRYWYVIAYRALIERLRRFDYLPFKVISPTVQFDPRGRTCVACLDLAEAYVHMAQRSPAFLEWNNIGVPMPDLAVLMGRAAGELRTGEYIRGSARARCS